MKFRKVLIVHPAPMVRNLIRGYLNSEASDAKTHEASNAAEAFTLLSRHSFDCILMAHQLEDQGELKIISLLSNQGQIQKVALLHSQDSERENFAKIGVQHFLSTPFRARELSSLLNQVANPRLLRSYERYNVHGVTARLAGGDESITGAVLNLSEEAALVELDLGGQWPDITQLTHIDLEFPNHYPYRLLPGLQAFLSKMQVTERLADNSPKTLRSVWLFGFPEPAQAEALRRVLQQVALEQDLLHSQAV